jgi:hypothetical protein
MCAKWLPLAIRRRLTKLTRPLYGHLEGQGDPLAATDAHRNDTFLETVPTHRMEKSGCQDSACRADRMTVCNRATLDIHDAGRQPKFPHDGKRYTGVRPRRSAQLSLASTIAAAAVFSPGALPAVIVPSSRKAGFSLVRASIVARLAGYARPP